METGEQVGAATEPITGKSTAVGLGTGVYLHSGDDDGEDSGERAPLSMQLAQTHGEPLYRGVRGEHVRAFAPACLYRTGRTTWTR